MGLSGCPPFFIFIRRPLCFGFFFARVAFSPLCTQIFRDAMFAILQSCQTDGREKSDKKNIALKKFQL